MVVEFGDKSADGQTERVLLEEKSFANRPSECKGFVARRVTELAMILAKSPKPARMRVLDCAGFAPNRKDQTFSLIFRFPQKAATNTDPVSLQHLLLAQGPDAWSRRQKAKIAGSELQPPPFQSAKPALHTRFCMAQSLAQSFSLLQACGMLHKGISPAHVVFFKSKTAKANYEGIDRDLTAPFIAGFTWARLHGPEFLSDEFPSSVLTPGSRPRFHDISDELSRGNISISPSGLLRVHPAYSYSTDQRYLKLLDLYSLGLVLLQIGLWRTLQDIADELFPSAKSMVNAVGAKLDEVDEQKGSDAWLMQRVWQWRTDLVGYQNMVSQEDGLASQREPRKAFQEALVQHVERLLVPAVGEIYARVVKCCLACDIENDGVPDRIVEPEFDESDPEYILQEAIVRNLVEELEKCSA